MRRQVVPPISLYFSKNSTANNVASLIESRALAMEE